MKTNLITTLGLISFIFALSFGINAQTTIPNGTFETWQNIGASDEEPTNWNGNKTGGGFANLGPQTCFRESGNVHSGSYCMRLENGSFFGTHYRIHVMPNDAPEMNIIAHMPQNFSYQASVEIDLQCAFEDVVAVPSEVL